MLLGSFLLYISVEEQFWWSPPPVFWVEKAFNSVFSSTKFQLILCGSADFRADTGQISRNGQKVEHRADWREWGIEEWRRSSSLIFPRNCPPYKRHILSESTESIIFFASANQHLVTIAFSTHKIGVICSDASSMFGMCAWWMCCEFVRGA